MRFVVVSMEDPIPRQNVPEGGGAGVEAPHHHPPLRAAAAHRAPTTTSFHMHFGLYALISLVLACVVSWKEWKSAQGIFYVTVVSLVHSKPATLVFANLAMVSALILARGVKSVFLGTLRDVEAEHLTERLSGSVMDTLLAMTIFRAEISMSFAVQFVGLVFIKAFHWLVQKRADYVGQTPVTSPSVYLRLATLQGLLLTVDIAMAWLAIAHLRKHGANIQLLFAFEYGLLATTIASVSIKYALTLYDMLACQGRWDAKSMVFLYLDFVVDMIQVVVYMLFFVTVLVNYGLPLHIIRQIHQTFISFQRRIGDLLRYRRATKHLEANFPAASPSEIDAAHNVCCICREELQQNAKKLPNCGHVMHLRCLRGWLEHQQRCPICRTPVLFEDLEPEQQRQRLEQMLPRADAAPTHPTPAVATVPVQMQIGAAMAPVATVPLSSMAPSSSSPVETLNAVLVLQTAVSGMQQQLQAIQDQLDVITVILSDQAPTAVAATSAATEAPIDDPFTPRTPNSQSSSSSDSPAPSESIGEPSGPATDDPVSEDDLRRHRVLRFSSPSQ